MVSKTQHKEMLFDDTPRGLLEAMLVVGGFVAVMSTAPTLFVALSAVGFVLKGEDRVRRGKLQNSFQYALRNGYVRKRIAKDSIRIELTPRGRARALSIREKRVLSSPINRPRVWDKKWRLILFDIPSEERTKRNAFRSFVQQSGAVMLQKSVWLFPFDCSERIALLRNIFNLPEDELRLVIVESIGEDKKFRTHFRLG